MGHEEGTARDGEEECNQWHIKAAGATGEGSEEAWKGSSDKVYANEAKAGFPPHPLFMTWFSRKWLVQDQDWPGDADTRPWGRVYTPATLQGLP